MLDTLAFVMRRASRYWQVLVILSLGVVFATALLASAPPLVNTVIEFGMRRTLLEADPTDANLRLVLRSEPDVEQYREMHAAVQDLVYSYLGPQLRATVPGGSTRWMFPWVDGGLLTRRRINFRFYDRTFGEGDTGLHKHADLVYGYWPEVARPPDGVVPVVIGDAMAKVYGLEVRDRLGLSSQESAQEPDLWIEIAGILRPVDPQDSYWFGTLSPLRAQHSAHYEDQFSVLVAPDVLLELASDRLGGSQVELAWHLLIDPGALVFDDQPRLRAALDEFSRRTTELDARFRVETALDDSLDAFAVKADAVRAPMYLLTATVLLLALYYVTMDAALSVRQFGREFAVLRSRGASAWQLFRAQLVEASLIGLVALLSGPGLALLLVRAVAVLGPLADVRQPGWAIWLPQASWIAAIVGATACVVSLLLPVPGALRRSIVVHQQSLARANRPPWWQRFYVDVFALVAGLVLIWRLRVYGSILGGAPSRPQVDWLLLLAPLALLLGSAAILLRVFPVSANLIARLVSRGRGLPATLALWQVSRDPTHVARLVLLLTLAMALGLFSTGLNAALDRNERDQSYYTVGSDLQLNDPLFGSRATLLSVPGVRQVASVRRDSGSIAVETGDSYPAFGLIAVDPVELADTARFRSDFADRPVSELLDALQVDTPVQPTLPLPDSLDGLGLWVWLPESTRETVSRIGVTAKLEARDGRFEHFRLRLSEAGSRPEEGWFYFEGSLPTEQPAARLHSLWFRSHAASSLAIPIDTLGVGDLVALRGELGRPAAVEGFGADDWLVYGQPVTVECGRAARATPDAHGTRLVLRFEGNGMHTGVWYGLQMATETAIQPLPALASSAFQFSSQADVGSPIGTWVNSQPLQFEVVGSVDYFPTMYEDQEAGYLISALAPLLVHLNKVTPSPVYANQLLVSVEPGIDMRALRSSVPDREVWEAEAVRMAIKADPLALGLRSVTLFGYLLTAVLSLAGFGTHFYISTRQRSRMYAVLRTMGLSPRQLYGMLLLEQAVLILLGLALGTVLGLLLNRLTLPGLPLSLGGRPPVPPFLAETDWAAVSRIYLTLSFAFLVSLGFATSLLWRVKLHRLLRVDEE